MPAALVRMPSQNPPPAAPPTPPAETATFRSFDGGVVERAAYVRPDRYRMVESLGAGPRIARGGGYSYAAASFGGGSRVVDMRAFDRLLRLDESQRLIEVEAGARLEDVLAITAPRGLYLPVQPGYPAITVGGCIAANVHGKNPHREGTFRRSVLDLTLHHPRTGTVRVSPDLDPELFELTCGGYGLTGIVLAATLRLDPLPGWVARVERVPIGGLAEGYSEIRARTDRSAFAYTWHDGTPSPRRFGRGFVYEGHVPPGPPPSPPVVPRYRRLTSASRGALRVPLWNRATTSLLGAGFRWAEERKTRQVDMPLFDAMFPFACRGEYFLLYGRRGLAEYQSLVPHAAAEGFLAALEREVARARPPLVMASMKLFRGERGLLRFESAGVCVTVNLCRTAEGVAFLSTLDRLTLDAGGLPHVVKDSRLPADVVAHAYAGYEEFRARRRAHDPAALFRSELSTRLGL
jgi:decaprenylphospho-beta-D-ribofuranose 2-oxidase